MKSRARKLLDKSIAAMVAAIDVYNKPDFAYRGEAFTILALNAWELLLKAKWLQDHNHRVQSLYVREKPEKKRPRYKRTRSGSYLTHGVQYLARKLAEEGKLDSRALKNLEALMELRDTSTHFYHQSPALDERVLEVGMACVKNFVSAVHDWFDEGLARFKFYLMPLSFVTASSSEAIRLNREEEAFVQFLDSLNSDHTDPSDRYAVAVNVELRFVRSKASSAYPVRVTKDPTAPAVRLTEEQIREQYPWDYRELTKRCRERYRGFKVNQKYHEIRKPLHGDQRFAHERRLDPEKPRPRKIFYAPTILDELDRHYEKK